MMGKHMPIVSGCLELEGPLDTLGSCMTCAELAAVNAFGSKKIRFENNLDSWQTYPLSNNVEIAISGEGVYDAAAGADGETVFFEAAEGSNALKFGATTI